MCVPSVISKNLIQRPPKGEGTVKRSKAAVARRVDGGVGMSSRGRNAKSVRKMHRQRNGL